MCRRLPAPNSCSSKLNGKNVYLLRDNSAEYTTLLAKYFDEAFTKGGGTIIARDDYKSGDKSFTAQITKLKALSDKPDVLYVAAMPDDIGLVVKQMRQAGVTQPIVGGDGYDTPLLIQVGGSGLQRRLLFDARLYGDRFHRCDQEVLHRL